MNGQQLFSLIMTRVKQVIGLYAFVLMPMWGMFFLNETVFLASGMCLVLYRAP